MHFCLFDRVTEDGDNFVHLNAMLNVKKVLWRLLGKLRITFLLSLSLKRSSLSALSIVPFVCQSMYECMFGKLKDRPQSRLRQGGLSRAIMIVREDDDRMRDDRMRDAVQHSCLLTNMQEMCDCAKEYIFQATHTQVSIVFSAASSCAQRTQKCK